MNDDHTYTPCQNFVDNSQLVLKVLQNLYEERQMCDVYLKVGDREYGAHKLILAASSDVFQVMFTKSNWNESKQNQIELFEIAQCEIVFSSFLQYFYTGKVMITHTNVQPILTLADKYNVKSLSQLCLQYMSDHIVHASSHNQLFIWLQYCQCCGHKDLASALEEFITFNFDELANSPDFVNLDIQNMILFLKKDELVVYDEAMLCKYVLKWLEFLKQKTYTERSDTEKTDTENDEHITEYMNYLIKLIMQHVRFPMIRPQQITSFLNEPFLLQNPKFFLERISQSIQLHSSDGKVKEPWMSENPALMTPRLYTSVFHSRKLFIQDYAIIEEFGNVSFEFMVDSALFEKIPMRKNIWKATLYPKGILFDPCYFSLWQNQYQIPKEVLSTVRLKISCIELCKPGMYKFSILIIGSRGKIEYIKEVKSKIYCIDNSKTTINIDEIIPFYSLNSLSADDNPYLTGENNNELKMHIIIMPVS